MSVVFHDKKVLDSFKNLRLKYAGKRTLPPASKFVREVKKELDVPFRQKKITLEDGQEKSWRLNAPSTVRKKFKRRGITIREKSVTTRDRLRFLLMDTGAMRSGLKARHDRKKSQFVKTVSGKSNKYAFIQQHGDGRIPARQFLSWPPKEQERLVFLIEADVAKTLR